MRCFEINEIFEIFENRRENLGELEKHVIECPECKKNYERIKEFFEAKEIEVPYEVKIRVKRKVFERVKRKERLKFLLIPSLLALFSVFLLVFIFMNRGRERILVFSPESEAVLTPEEVLFAFKIKDTKGLRIYIDDLDITDSLKSEGNIYYYLAENLELSPGLHNLLILKNEKAIHLSKFYLTSFKYSEWIIGN